jgi:VWA domain-containing protein
MTANFTCQTFQNQFLPEGASEMHAIVTVAGGGDAEEGAAPASGASRAELVIVDVSGSMKWPRTKITAARDATAAAIDCISDGVLFGVIAGDDDASQVYPHWGPLVPADANTRAEAKKAASKLKAGGGTVIGQWLRSANAMFAESGAAIRHAILLTDGEDEGESAADLDRALAECEGNFQCDCRGVGTDWRVEELRRIASALLGTVDIIAEPDSMANDFSGMMLNAMAKSVGDVRLRVWAPKGATVVFVKQVSPSIEDLTTKAVPFNELTTDYPTGSWGRESRDYHVCVRVLPQDVGKEVAAARVSLVVDGEVVSSPALVKATWTNDEVLSTRINREVAHYTGQAELAEMIQDGLAARRRGDASEATKKLGRAAQLAVETGNDATMKLLTTVVDVDDAETGTVRLKPRVADADEMTLDTRSTRTTRIEIAD